MVWEKRREMRPGNLHFQGVKQRKSSDLCQERKLVSVQDGAATGRKLVELTSVFVSVYAWKWLAEDLLSLYA